MKALCLFLSILFLLGTAVYSQQTGSFTDSRDGHSYKTVNIGDQVWMAENLNTDRFRNGDQIPEAKTISDWQRAALKKEPAWCYFGYNEDNGVKWGKFYNWYALTDKRGIAPEGWHVPTESDWDGLISSLGGEPTAGSKMKSESGWKDGGYGNNESGFGGTASGFVFFSGLYAFEEENGNWWISPQLDSKGSWVLKLTSSLFVYNYDPEKDVAGVIRLIFADELVRKDYTQKEDGFPIRCIKD